jgi:fructose-bisphosphate aldolase class I
MKAQEVIDTARAVVADDKAHVLAAQQALYHRARCNRAARRGEYNAAEDVYYANDPK